jgi:hypothetical protein
MITCIRNIELRLCDPKHESGCINRTCSLCAGGGSLRLRLCSAWSLAFGSLSVQGQTIGSGVPRCQGRDGPIPWLGRIGPLLAQSVHPGPRLFGQRRSLSHQSAVALADGAAIGNHGVCATWRGSGHGTHQSIGRAGMLIYQSPPPASRFQSNWLRNVSIAAQACLVVFRALGLRC